MDENNNGVVVSLGFSEMAIGSLIGAMRHIESVVRGRKDQHGFEGDGWGIHIEGALAEVAAAKALNVYWPASLNTFKSGGDLGPFEVRRRSKGDYDMLIRNSDADGKIHIAVFGSAPTFRVAGWILGKDAKRDKWVKTYGGRPPAWFVPQSELRPLELIREGHSPPVGYLDTKNLPKAAHGASEAQQMHVQEQC